MVGVRPAILGDLPAINTIYNHYVLSSTCTYQVSPDSDEVRAAWFAAHGVNHPILVGEIADEVVAWASLSPFRPRDGLRHTVESSVYVRHDRHRRGIGGVLLADLIARARGIGHHAIIAGISAEQTASVELHRRYGFTQVGMLREVGRKFERWLDLGYWQLVL